MEKRTEAYNSKLLLMPTINNLLTATVTKKQIQF